MAVGLETRLGKLSLGQCAGLLRSNRVHRDGLDIVVYDPLNATDVVAKDRHFLANPVAARRIAASGYVRALRHHRK